MLRNLFKPASTPVAFNDEYQLSDRKLPLKVTIHPRATRLTLRISAGGKAICVTIPLHTDPNDVYDFLDRHRGWIESRLAKLPPPINGTMLRAGTKIPLLGVPHLIVHRPGRGTIEIEKGDTPKIIVHGAIEHLPRRLSDYLKKLAETTIRPMIAKHAETVGRMPISIRFKDTKSRWGSCSADGQLSFSWRIIMAPRPIVDYLVAHEVAHLIEMNHSHDFWALCTKLCPDTKRCRAWLKRNGQALHAIEFR